MIAWAPDFERGGLERPGRLASRRARVAAVLLVFGCALGVRLLYAPAALDALYGARQERYRIAHFYHEAAAEIARGEGRMLFPDEVAPGETLVVGYPPGYFAAMGAIYRATGDSMGAVLLAQCAVDALACVLLLLLGEALFSTAVGAAAGLLMALSPQFAYLSLVLKPDTLVVVPVLAAMLLVVRAVRRDSLAAWAWAGVALGLACWLRQNALLLAPALAATALATSGGSGARGRWKGALLAAAVCAAVVAPITLRNLALYGRPIPVTVGSGFALLSGLARDDHAGRYGLPRFAYNFSVEEAGARGLPPDHYFVEYDRMQAARERKFDAKHTVLSVFAVDGIERDAERTRRAARLIADDPVYFASVYWTRVERLLGYTEQNRPVPIEAAAAARGYETLDFYRALDPSLGVWRYYAERGAWYDFARPAVAAAQRLFVTPLLLGLAAAGLLLVAAWSWRRALFLLVPAAYYVGLQSLMWAEFRHTLPVHAAAFLFAAVAAVEAARAVPALVSRARGRG